ncbi:transposase family protein [Saccharopolyspora sp. 5N102]|uniref:transposase family protein n=1 Tax=Saccharopolyspora sp. 5N102 TaxID=3375155 RepID=UPI0037B27DB1
MITYRATLDVADELAHYLSRLLAEERRRRSTPRGRRALSPFKQAVLGLRWYRDRTAIPALARDNDISRATGYRYVDEVIDVLAAQAPDLHEALEKAAEGGEPYVIVDGKLFDSDRLGEKTLNKHGEEIDRWYSGKHHTQGGNVLVITDHTGFPLWSSPVEPGRIHDITAATEHVLGALYWAASQLDLPTLADGGFQGAGIGVHTPIKHNKTGKGRPLDVDNRTYNALLRGLRARGERGFALLTQRWRTLQHITASPRKITAIVQAALTLTHHEHGRIH